MDHEEGDDMHDEEENEFKSPDSQGDEAENFDEQDDIRSTEDLLQKCMADELPTENERQESEMLVNKHHRKSSCGDHLPAQ